MIIVLCYNGDVATTSILDWLHAYGCRYKRINLEDEDFKKISMAICKGNGFGLKLDLKDGSVLDVDEVSYFLFRGGVFSFNAKSIKDDKIPHHLAANHLQYEFKTLTNFFYKEVSKKCLGNLILNPLNKLDQLKTAQEVGLYIPDSFVCYKRDQLIKSTHNNTYITKSIQESIFGIYQGIHYDLKVNEIDVNEIEEHFFPSFFQESVNKVIEIRSFYLDEKFYSIAMLLSASKSRVIDFRTRTKDIRYSKYQLPQSIEDKLQSLMKKLDLNTGSLDLILSDKGDYYFLEVNPTGQFEWVSYYGNYYIEQEIAKFLAKKNKEYEIERN